MNEITAININLLSSKSHSFRNKPALWLSGLILLMVLSGVGFYIYQYQCLKQEQLTNKLLNEELAQQSRSISEIKPSRTSEQATIDKHRRIRGLIDTINSHTDIIVEIQKTLPPEILVKMIDVAGTSISISGTCTDYDILAAMIDNIDKTGTMEISKTECTQSVFAGEIDFVVKADWNKI